jgi:hypothetical protein
MAFVSSGFFLSVTMVDYGVNETRKRWKMTAANNAAALTDAAIVIAALEAVTDAEVTAYSVEQGFNEDTIVPPTVVNPVSVVASNTASVLGGGNKKVNFSIPAPDIAIFEGPTGDAADIVDVADAAVIAYVALFKTGGQLFLSDGERINAHLKGIRVTQKRRLSGGN